jgi:hypothetical protein
MAIIETKVLRVSYLPKRVLLALREYILPLGQRSYLVRGTLRRILKEATGRPTTGVGRDPSVRYNRHSRSGKPVNRRGRPIQKRSDYG